MNQTVALRDVQSAARTLFGRIRRTPLIPLDAVAQRVGVPVFAKAENFQIGGAFKIRGATNAVALAMQRGPRPAGVVTYSSGNHGQGCAIAARSFGLPAIVVMPVDAPRVKVQSTLDYGAEVQFAGRTSEERRVVAESIAIERGFLLVRPFDDADVVAGQGTVGLEIMEDLPETETVLVPCGGGGLTSGIALAVTALKPSARVFSVEPEAAPKLARSMEAGRIVSSPPGASIADGLRPNAPGAIPFEIVKNRLAGSVLVDDDAIERAVRLLLSRAKIVAEPSGAATVAALMSGKITNPKGPVVAVLSGGNIDPAVLARILARDEPW
ncbi:MAG: threonine/serine dehydratase [Planctomycetes bacterium]|nr:threonine/serine dehydratase [Planctomycetota bacterium]